MTDLEKTKAAEQDDNSLLVAYLADEDDSYDSEDPDTDTEVSNLVQEEDALLFSSEQFFKRGSATHILQERK